MGDRTSVTLTVPAALANEAEALLEKHDGDSGTRDDTDDQYTEFELEEVNYGDLYAEKHLTAAGIAWSKIHGSGGGYTAGRAWAMFREDGSLSTIALGEEDREDVLGPFFELLGDPAALIEALKIEQAKLTSPPWDNQVEYGKRYRTRKLIDPTADPYVAIVHPE